MVGSSSRAFARDTAPSSVKLNTIAGRTMPMGIDHGARVGPPSSTESRAAFTLRGPTPGRAGFSADGAANAPRRSR